MRVSEQIVNELRSYDKEKEWFEFKENWFSPDELVRYISALSNSAIEGRKFAYFVWESMIRHIRLSEQYLIMSRILIMSQ